MIRTKPHKYKINATQHLSSHHAETDDFHAKTMLNPKWTKPSFHPNIKLPYLCHTTWCQLTNKSGACVYIRYMW